MPRLVDAVVGSWRISAIQRYQSGAPLGIASNQNLFGAGNPRASFAPGAGVTVPLINPAWNSSNAIAASVPGLNKAAFVIPANMTYGNTPLRIAQLRGPKTINEDFALLKNFNVTEKRYFEFRLSAFNALNRHNISRTGHEYGQLDLRIDYQPPRQHATKCPTGDAVLFLICLHL